MTCRYCDDDAIDECCGLWLCLACSRLHQDEDHPEDRYEAGYEEYQEES